MEEVQSLNSLQKLDGLREGKMDATEADIVNKLIKKVNVLGEVIQKHENRLNALEKIIGLFLKFKKGDFSVRSKL